MMGFGSSNANNIGGFAPSSSNLSPLAPPFTVDRPTSRSPLNINAAPYATPYASSNCYQPAPVTETAASSLFPSSTVYSAAPPVEPQVDHVFSQFPGSLMNHDFGDGDYYAPASTWDTVSVLAQDEFGYKTSSSLKSAGITHDNYTQSLYGLQYPSQWDLSCDGRLDIESGGKNSFLDRAAPQVPNSTGASANRNYFKEGRELPKVNVSNLKHNPVRSLDTAAVVDKPYLEFNAKEKYASTVSALPCRTTGISYAATPDNSIMDPWGHLVPPAATNVTVHQQHFSDCSPLRWTSFHEVTAGQPSVVTSSTTSGSLPLQNNVMQSGNDLSGKSDGIVYDCLYNVKDSFVCQKSKQGQETKKYMDISASNTDSQRYDSGVVLFPTKHGEQIGVKNVTSGPLDVFKHEIADKHDNLHNLEGFSLFVDESDQYNPSEDSPCWKGSSSYFSQFQVSEAIPSQHHLKSKNSHIGLNLNEPQTFSLSCEFPNTVLSTDFHDKTTHSSDGCLGEAETLLSSTERGYIGNHRYDEVKSDVSHTFNKFGAIERNSGNGFCVPNDNHKPVIADAGEMESSRVQKPEPSNPVRLCLETISCMSEKDKAEVGMMNTDVNLNDAPEECQSYVPSNAAKQVLSSLSSDADISSKHNQENWDEYATESKSMLLKTIVNLSDSLLFYYLNDENPVGNDDYKILELVLSKLTMCLKSAQEKSGIKECSTRKQGPSSISNEVQACHHEMTNKPQVTQAKYHEDGAILGCNSEGLANPVRADGTEEAGSMTKAIKEVLDANFHEDTESHPLATMYKNLWLEAEAVLCATNYKARYHRMKNEMQKCGPRDEKEKSLECNASPTHVDMLQESSNVSKPVHAADIMERYNILKCRVETSDKGTVGELDSSKISSDQKPVDKLSTQVSGHTTSETLIKDANFRCLSHDGPATNVPGNSSTIGTTSTYHTNIAEDHIMSRLQVLKTRGDYPSCTNPEQEPSEFTTDSVGKRDCSPICGVELLGGTGIIKATVAQSDDGFEGLECASGSQPDCQKFSHTSQMAELGVQFSGGWYENTSSDWEHVLKDEFTWTGGAVNP